MKRRILRYNDKVQKLLKSKTKPEPWLHVVLMPFGNYVNYAVYVWDTRQVVEQNKAKIADNVQTDMFGGKMRDNALDNKQPLVGIKIPQLEYAFNKKWTKDDAKNQKAAWNTANANRGLIA